jgi:hypothetical protein
MKQLDGEDPQESRNTIQGVRDSLKRIAWLERRIRAAIFLR